MSLTGGTRKEISGPNYVSYLSELKKRTDVMVNLLATIRIKWTEENYYICVSDDSQKVGTLC